MSDQSKQQLFARQTALLDQLKQLESKFARLSQRVIAATGVDTRVNKKTAKDSTKDSSSNSSSTPKQSPKPSPSPASASSPKVYSLPSDDDPSRWWDASSYTADTQGVVPRLSGLCREMKLSKWRFYRVKGDYYDRTLEERRDMLGVPTIRHLCKSVIMQNTHFAPPENAGNPKLILVIVSYAEKLHKERLSTAVYEHYKNHPATPQPPKSKRQYDANWRLADNDEAIALTGYEHNGMTPIGMKTDFLIVFAASLLNLEGGSFALGGGEVDVKWRISIKEFIETFKPIVADITTA